MPWTSKAMSSIARSGLTYLWNVRPVGMWLISSTQPISITRSPLSGDEAGGFGIEDDLAGHQVFLLRVATSSSTTSRVSSIVPLVSMT